MKGSRGLALAAASSWLASAAALATGVIRGKVSAVELGPSGVGVVGQLNSLSLLGGSLAVLGLGTGALQLIGRQRAAGDDHGVKALVRFVIRMPFFLSLFVVVGASVMASPLAGLMLGGREYGGYLVVAMLSVPLNVLAGCIGVVLQADGRAARAAVATLIALPLNTAIVIGAVVWFKLPGAVFGVLATSLAPVIIHVMRERSWLRTAFKPARLPTPLLRELAQLAGASCLLGVVSAAVDSTVRAILTRSLGLVEAGLFQVLSMASTQGFLSLVTGVMVYLGPALASLILRDPRSAAAEIQRVWGLLMGVVLIAGWVCTAFATPALNLLFSPDFVAAAPALRFQAAGEILRAAAFVVGAVMLPLGLRRTWLVLGLATMAAQVGFLLLLTPTLGLEAAPAAFGLAWAINLAVSCAVAHSHRLLPRRESMLSGAGAFSVVLCAALWGGASKVVLAITGLAALCLGLWLVIRSARGTSPLLRIGAGA
jgi:polysaccharide transporter, PST family